MKKLALSAKVMMLMMAFVAASCANNEKASSSVTVDDTTAKVAVNIRYIDADSIAAHYNLAKDFNEAQLRSISKIDNAQRSRGAELQKLANSIQQKMNNNGYLSQASYEEDMKNLNKKQSDAENYIASLQREAQQEMVQQQMQLTDSIESFIKEYNATKKYDAILYKAAGVYFNPDLDITDEVIKGLNARYNKVEK
ncbi:MAG: OmpH family outer membrane protein [Lachnospiraceae bacterium]|nr:OmpH family outer membrane protein [Lachnospiraceae bacterium]